MYQNLVTKRTGRLLQDNSTVINRLFQSALNYSIWHYNFSEFEIFKLQDEESVYDPTKLTLILGLARSTKNKYANKITQVLLIKTIVRTRTS